MNRTISKRIQESLDSKQKLLDDRELLQQIEDVTSTIIDKIKEGGSVYFCGNGGSAADAQHLAAELSGRFYFDREPLAAEALHCNTSFMTAVGNDYSFDVVYSRLIKGLGKTGDVLIGLSTSGNSKNIILAMEQAKAKGILTIALTGSKGGELLNIADFIVRVPSDDTPRIQEMHMLLGHIICELIESKLFVSK